MQRAPVVALRRFEHLAFVLMQDRNAAVDSPAGVHRARRDRMALFGFIAGSAAIYAISGGLTAVSVAGWKLN